MYKRLEIVNYEDYKNYDKEYQIRYNSPAVLKTGLSIHPFNKRQQKRLPESYQLFYLPLPKHISMIEQIYKMSAKLSSFSLSNILTQKLFYSQIIDEIQSTNDMEGVKSTRKEINEAYISPSKTKRFSGIVGMYKSMMRCLKIRNQMEDYLEKKSYLWETVVIMFIKEIQVKT